MFKTLIIHTAIDIAINNMFDNLILNMSSVELYAIERDSKNMNAFDVIKLWADVLEDPTGTPIPTMKKALEYAKLLTFEPISKWPDNLRVKYLHCIGHVFR